MKVRYYFSLFLIFLLAGSSFGQEEKVKYVIKKGGARIPIINILQDLNYQFKGKKIIIPHPTVISTPPIVFQSTMTLSYPEIRAVLQINGIELVESKVDGTTMITAYSNTSLPSLRSVITPFYEDGEKLPEGNMMVTQAFRVENVDANRLFALLRSIIFTDPNRVGNVFYVQGGSSLIMRDLKENVEYYGRIIKTLDKKQEEMAMEIIKLQNASAEDVSRLGTQLIQARSQAQRSGGSAAVPAQMIGDNRTNKIIIFAPPEDIKNYVKFVKEVDEKVDEGDTGQVHVIKLQNVKAEDLGPKLNELMTGQQQSYGRSSNTRGPGGTLNPAKKKTETRIVAEPKSNSLIIQAEVAEFKRVVKLIEKLDISPPQVLMESHIFEVEESRSLNIGTEIGSVDPSVSNSIRGAGLTNFGLSQIIIDPANPNRISRIPNASTGVIAGLHKGGFDRLPLLVNLLGTDRSTNILAEPFAVTNDNEEAIFKDETEIPTLQQNQTSSNVNFVTQQGSVTASTTLKITPHISPGDYLRLDIDLQLEDFGAQSNQNTTPPKTRRSYKGSVTVQNGRFLVIGGLTRTDFTQTINKVPILGDIPILGYLFSNRTKTRRKLNIYIFIRAYILQKGDYRADRVTGHWMKKAVETSEHDFREDYGSDKTRQQIKATTRGFLIDPSDNLLGKYGK